MESDLNIETEVIDSVVVMSFSGEINFYNVSDIHEKIESFIEEKKYNIVFDFENVKTIDSSGIGALISNHSQLFEFHGGLKIVNIFGSVRKVFNIAKLSSLLDVFDSVDEAVKSFDS